MSRGAADLINALGTRPAQKAASPFYFMDGGKSRVDLAIGKIEHLEWRLTPAGRATKAATLMRELDALERGVMPGGRAAPGGSVKAVGNSLEGWLVKFNYPAQGDLSAYRDIFDPGCDFGSRKSLPVLFEHARDPQLKGEVLGEGEITIDRKVGVWIRVQLARRSVWVDAIKKLAAAGHLDWSSGANPSTVKRTALGDGRHRILRWELIEGSLTCQPAGIGTNAALKSLSLLREGDNARRERLLREIEVLERSF